MAASSMRFDFVRRSSADDRRIVQGSTWTPALSFDSRFGVDWTGFAARCQLRRHHADRTGASVVAQVQATIVNPGPDQRIIELHLSADQTAAIRDTSGTWDVEIYNGTTVTRVGAGVWALSRETTR